MGKAILDVILCLLLLVISQAILTIFPRTDWVNKLIRIFFFFCITVSSLLLFAAIWHLYRANITALKIVIGAMSVFLVSASAIKGVWHKPKQRSSLYAHILRYFASATGIAGTILAIKWLIVG